MFGLVKKFTSVFSNSVATENISIDSLTEPQLAFLSEFLKPRNIHKLPNGWEMMLNRPLAQVCTEYIKRGVLVSPPRAMLLEICYTVPELKSLLRENELPVSGNKKILIERLLPIADSIGNIDKDIYLCSVDVAVRVDEYLKKKSEEESAVADKVLQLLSERRVKLAIGLVEELKKSYTDKNSLMLSNNPMTIKEPEGYREKLLTLLLSAKPNILSDFSAEDLERLRLSAAMWQIGFYGQHLELPLHAYIGTDRFCMDTARRMVLFYCTNKLRLEKILGLGNPDNVFVHFEITTGYAHCKVAQTLQCRKYQFNELPELPYPDCREDMGCGCMIKTTINWE